MRITRDQMLYDIVQVIARRGTCSRLQVGALVHRAGRILVTGYNGTAAGLDHCFHPEGNTDPCTKAVHAEANCIAWAARYGLSLGGSEMITTHSPCRDCVKLIINSGIMGIQFGEFFRDTSPLKDLHTLGLYTNCYGLSRLDVLKP